MTVKEFMELEPGDVIVGGPEQYFIFITLDGSLSSGFFTEKLPEDLSEFEKYYDDEWDSWDFAHYSCSDMLSDSCFIAEKGMYKKEVQRIMPNYVNSDTMLELFTWKEYEINRIKKEYTKQGGMDFDECFPYTREPYRVQKPHVCYPVHSIEFLMLKYREYVKKLCSKEDSLKNYFFLHNILTLMSYSKEELLKYYKEHIKDDTCAEEVFEKNKDLFDGVKKDICEIYKKFYPDCDFLIDVTKMDKGYYIALSDFDDYIDVNVCHYQKEFDMDELIKEEFSYPFECPEDMFK